jgi:hypothetical protein
MKRMFILVLLSTISLITIFSLSVIISNPIFAQKTMQTYTNVKCGVSIQYPEEWEVENDDYKTEKLRSFIDISPDPDDFSNQISIGIWDIADYTEKTIEYISEVFRPLEDDTETGVIQDDIIQVGGFPAQKLAYFEGIPGEYEFQEEKTHFMEINILAYDRVYQIYLEAENQENFDEYSPIVEQMKDTLKINKPNFEGINC